VDQTAEDLEEGIATNIRAERLEVILQHRLVVGLESVWGEGWGIAFRLRDPLIIVNPGIRSVAFPVILTE
jgi:hypothetical protein